jgi:hypothetical protein
VYELLLHTAPFEVFHAIESHARIDPGVSQFPGQLPIFEVIEIHNDPAGKVRRELTRVPNPLGPDEIESLG